MCNCTHTHTHTHIYMYIYIYMLLIIDHNGDVTPENYISILDALLSKCTLKLLV